MRTFAKAFIVVALAAPSCSPKRAHVNVAPGIRNIDPEIRSYLLKRASREASEYQADADPYVSDLVRGDIDGDGVDDVFLSFAIEGIDGGNGAFLYQALFLNEKGTFVFTAERANGTVGTAQGRSFKPLKIEAGKIICETLTYAPDDGACCPSIRGSGEILFKNGKLSETTAEGR